MLLTLPLALGLGVVGGGDFWVAKGRGLENGDR